MKVSGTPFESRVFPEGTQTEKKPYFCDTSLRAVYFQRGLKPSAMRRNGLYGLRAVYFQREP